MSGSFFWLALFPMILGSIILVIFIFYLKKKEREPEDPGSKRMTPLEFIDEVAQHSDIDNAEAERMIEFVFSYFPEFNWRKNLPRMRDRKKYEGGDEKGKKIEPTAGGKET